MLHVMQYLVLCLYAALPPAMLAWAVAARYRQGRVWPVVSFLFLCASGLAGGVVFMMLDRRVAGGRLPELEIARLLYFSVAVVCALKLLDRGLLRGAFWLAQVRLDRFGRPATPVQWRAMGVLAIQRLLLAAIAIPFVASLVMTCRPKVLHEGNPQNKFKADFASVQFYARDGVTLAGWWIPAKSSQNGGADAENRRASRTVIICHGIGSGKEDELGLAEFLVRGGFNVFLFDFRGCGESGGAFVTYGDRERWDVLGAAQWIRANHQREARQLYGIGSNTGAAALLAAATEDEGSIIDAVVLYEPFARLSTTADQALEVMMPAPLDWLVRRIGLPLACLHTGSDLIGFAPADSAQKLWPRPALVVHGRGSTFVPLWQEMELYQQLMQPKEQFWPAEAYSEMRQRILRSESDAAMLMEMFRQWIGTSGRISDDRGVREATMRFLREAKAVRVL